MTHTIVRGYAAAAEALIGPYEAVATAEVLAPVIDLLPVEPSRIADIGAGTGRDAAWLAEEGHRVTAVEPVAPFRLAGQKLHRRLSIDWLDDRLPDLGTLRTRGPFDMALLNGVWQHLDSDAQEDAMRSLVGILRPGGLAVLSLRHGPGAADRPVFPIDTHETLKNAEAEGFAVLRAEERGSIQSVNRAAGVTWTWVALLRG
ncbi:class I SAM-dependent methyltransferase [Rhizobiales bacterium]|uniref:class I SAM-dependent methyltransferase n=1 Tax=Hongsoonwoonella zoysiae TaxID=2821844 RepID=UPI0015600417|nr:class I SAM-dependent methyltransferase [Hongsoonwoonella zoysiae]NRG19921.1 class I SAM-dependent methyltransferase [Hongsoonwoonella zoysiae]